MVDSLVLAPDTAAQSLPTFTPTSQASGLNNISAEVLGNIFSYLDDNDRLTSGDVCRYWEDIVFSPQEIEWRHRRFTLKSLMDEVLGDTDGCLPHNNDQTKPIVITLCMAERFIGISHHVRHLSGTMDGREDPDIFRFYTDMAKKLGSQSLFSNLRTLNGIISIPSLIKSLGSTKLERVHAWPVGMIPKAKVTAGHDPLLARLSLISAKLQSLWIYQERLLQFHDFSIFSLLSDIKIHATITDKVMRSILQVETLRNLDISKISTSKSQVQKKVAEDEPVAQAVDDSSITQNTTSVERLALVIPECKDDSWKSTALYLFSFPSMVEVWLKSASLQFISRFLDHHSPTSQNLRSVTVVCHKPIATRPMIDTLKNISELEIVTFSGEGYLGWKGGKATARPFLERLQRLRQFHIKATANYPEIPATGFMDAEVLEEFLTKGKLLEVLSLPVDAKEIKWAIGLFMGKCEFEPRNQSPLREINLTLFHFGGEGLIARVAWWLAILVPNVERWSIKFHGHSVQNSQELEIILVERYKQYVIDHESDPGNGPYLSYTALGGAYGSS